MTTTADPNAPPARQFSENDQKRLELLGRYADMLHHVYYRLVESESPEPRILVALAPQDPFWSKLIDLRKAPEGELGIMIRTHAECRTLLAAASVDFDALLAKNMQTLKQPVLVMAYEGLSLLYFLPMPKAVFEQMLTTMAQEKAAASGGERLPS